MTWTEDLRDTVDRICTSVERQYQSEIELSKISAVRQSIDRVADVAQTIAENGDTRGAAELMSSSCQQLSNSSNRLRGTNNVRRIHSA